MEEFYFKYSEIINIGWGFFFSVILGHYVISSLISQMWEVIELDISKSPETKRYKSQPSIVGIIERALYFSALLMGHPEFIAVWLTLKTVSRSPRWSGEDKRKKKKKNNQEKDIPGRALYNIFLAGNGLSILFSLAGYGVAVTQYIDKTENNIGLWNLGIILSIILVVGFIYKMSEIEMKRIKSKRTNL